MKLPSWLKNRRAMIGVEDMAIVILIFAVTAIIAILVFTSIYTALPALPAGGAANTTVTAFATSFYSSIQLLGVTLIVMAAVSVIGVIMWLRNRGG